MDSLDGLDGLDPLDNPTRFRDAYLAHLRAEYDAHPECYRYPRESIPDVAARVVVALATTGVASFTPAMRATCKALGIKPSEKAAGEYLRKAGL